MSLLLYGVVRAAHPEPEGCRLVGWRDLAVLAGVLPAGHSPGEADALAQLRVLSTVVAQGPVVPLRFGTIAADEDAVRTDVLAPAAAGLRTQLDRLDGLVEVHVYLRFDEDTGLRAVHSTSPDTRRFSVRRGPIDIQAQLRLGELVSDRLTAWRTARAQELLAPITAVARDSTPLPDRDPVEDRRAFLLPRDRLASARTLVAKLTGAHAELVGPLPAYSFLAARPERASRWGW